LSRELVRRNDPLPFGSRYCSVPDTVNLRSYHLYLLNTTKAEKVDIGGVKFVSYADRFLDPRNRSASKASLVLNYLREHPDKAYFSKTLAELLKLKGVRISDIMANARRYEKRGFIYVRGYRTNERQTPFKEGYLPRSPHLDILPL
jgi:hypothetical protein